VAQNLPADKMQFLDNRARLFYFIHAAEILQFGIFRGMHQHGRLLSCVYDWQSTDQLWLLSSLLLQTGKSKRAWGLSSPPWKRLR